jgi:hypothetical protein
MRLADREFYEVGIDFEDTLGIIDPRKDHCFFNISIRPTALDFN